MEETVRGWMGKETSGGSRSNARAFVDKFFQPLQNR